MIETEHEAVNALRGAAEHFESEYKWLHGEVREFLRSLGCAGSDAGLDMAMAQEAMESLCRWLRKASSDIKSLDAVESREDGA